MKISELTRTDEIGILSVDGYVPADEDVDLSDPRYDSREVKPGSTFVAIKGFTVDGHQFIDKAIALGASTVVIEDAHAITSDEAMSSRITRIVVSDTRRALAHISEIAFDRPSRKIRLIGITGTNGKTTTSHIIKQLLELNGEAIGAIGTIGTVIGHEQLPTKHTTPESRELSELLAIMVERGVKTCVMEVSSHALALKRVAALDFDIAAFTNLTQDHLDFHVDMEDYFRSKEILFTGLQDTAVAITNADSEYGERIVENTVATAHTYGMSDGQSLGRSDLVASTINPSLLKTSFTVSKRYSEEQAYFETSLVGRFNVENLLAAISTLYFGIEGYSLEKLSGLVAKVQGVRGRFETLEIAGKVIVIDYAHTPDALENVLATLSELMEQSGGKRRLWCVFGCGGDRDKGKRPQMGAIAARLADRVIITNDNPRSERPEVIAQEILAGIDPQAHAKCEVILDRRESIQYAFEHASFDDVILVAGKGHETYQIIGGETRHFDDREEVMALIDR